MRRSCMGNAKILTIHRGTSFVAITDSQMVPIASDYLLYRQDNKTPTQTRQADRRSTKQRQPMSSESDQSWQRPNQASAIDPKMEDLRQMILSGFPNDKRNLTAAIRPFWHVCEQFSIDQKDGMIVVIPKACTNQDLIGQ
ncbi:hypothetical protein T02_10106 [Trichinella nativa]|uniref:Uncharacterized protein n=1 Tax=Trichinella nativa TaxID=6335 RepID=A0A0V1LDB4_9BILA|nr:hypothetical protein T02_10106 [Trichinella nativa]